MRHASCSKRADLNWFNTHNTRFNLFKTNPMKSLYHLTTGKTLIKASLGLMTGIVCLAATQVQAFQVTYTFSAVGSGSLGGNSFSGVAFTITSVADTTSGGFLGAGVPFLNDTSANVFITGLGAANFTSPTITVANNNLGAAGISDPGLGLAILFAEQNLGLNAYDLTTSIGPLTGTAADNIGQPFPTDDGNFIIRSVGDVTFTAVANPNGQNVPEAASTLCLLGLGVTALCGARKFGKN